MLWARLSIFAGEFDLQAAENVCCSDAIPPEDVYDLVAGLIDKSIVVREDHGGGVRYRLLETIRQYGRMLLAESGEEEVLRRRHRDHYQQLVMCSEEALFGPHQLRWYERLHLEHDNVRAALDFCLTEPDEVPAEESLEKPKPEPTGDEDVLEETPEFLQETPEHDRLWFEQKPPRDFDWDK